MADITEKTEKIFMDGYDDEKIEEDSLKPSKMITRYKTSASSVLEYVTFTRSLNESSTYFQSVLYPENTDVKNSTTNQTDNFILNLFLPLPMVGSITYSSRQRIKSTTTLFGFKPPIDRIDEIIAGSSSEGLGIPQMTHIRGHGYEIEIPDEDTKYVFSKLFVHATKRDAFAIPEHSPHSPPCFVNLRYNKDFKKKSCLTRSSVRFDKALTRNGYIDRRKFVRLLYSVLKCEIYNTKKESDGYKCKGGTKPTIKFRAQGPAISVDVKDEMLNTVLSKDYVICLPCPTWPEQANLWPKRKRFWPLPGIVQKVVREGCHIIPKAHKAGQNHVAEFMYSFSLCDITICESLNSNQKRSFIILKYIFKHFLNKAKRGLNSYFCKTVFFWRCETSSESDWKETNPLRCLVILLEDLRNYLLKKFLPHYYIPDYNLFSKMTNRSMDACIRDIEIALKEPTRLILDLSDTHRFLWFSRDLSLRSFLSNLSQELALSRQMMCKITLNFLSALLDKGNVPFVMSILCQNWTADYYIEPKICVKTLERLISSHGDYEEIVSFKGLLANMYHDRYEREEDVRSLVSSITIFEDIMEKVGQHTWIIGAYYDALLSVGEYQEIILHFMLKMHPNNKCSNLLEPGRYSSIAYYNRLTTFPDDFSFTDFFVVPSTAFILYKVTLAYLGIAFRSKMQKKKAAYTFEARRVLQHLTKWTKRKCELYPELFDDYLLLILAKAALNARDINTTRFAYKEVLTYKQNWGCVEFSTDEMEDDTKEYKRDKTSRKNMRFQPYGRRTRSKKYKIPENLVFKPFRVTVGPFIHY